MPEFYVHLVYTYAVSGTPGATHVLGPFPSKRVAKRAARNTSTSYTAWVERRDG